MDSIRVLYLPNASSPAQAGHVEGPSLRPVAVSRRDGPLSIKPGASRPPPPRRPRHRGLRTISTAAILAAIAIAAGFAGASQRGKASISQHVASPSLKSSDDGAPVRWRGEQLDVTLDPSLGSLGPAGKDAVRNAMGAWLAANPDLPNIVFDQAASPGAQVAQDGVSRISAGPITMPGHENDLAITVTWSNASSGAIVEVDMVFNTAHRFSSSSVASDEHEADEEHEHGSHSCDGSYDLQNVATHEFGHFFGLGEDRTEPLATMFVESHPCETLKRDLYTTDLRAVDSLYAGSGPENAALPGVSCALVRPSPNHAGWVGMFGAAAAILAASRRKRG